MKGGLVFAASALNLAMAATFASSVTTSDEGEGGLRDVRGIALEERLPPFVLTGGLLILAITVLALWRRHARRRLGTPTVCAPARSSGLDEIELLRKTIGDRQRSRRSLVIELDRIVRAGLSVATNIHAGRCSSTELARGLAPHLDEQMRDEVRGLLELVDRVKFAGHEPDSVETGMAFDISERLVNTISAKP